MNNTGSVNQRKRNFNKIQKKIFAKQFELTHDLKTISDNLHTHIDATAKIKLHKMSFLDRLYFLFTKRIR